MFRVSGGAVEEIPGSTVPLERGLQRLIEANMPAIFGVRFLDTEYSTGAKHGGRIDSLGIDENGTPVIFEYKRAVNENVINQGLFYLDWLVDHRAEFQLLVMKKLGAEEAEAIDWRSPRLVCVASDFTKYDVHAVQQMGRSIDLVRYTDFQGELLTIELVESTKTEPGSAGEAPTPPRTGAVAAASKTVTEYLAQSPKDLADLYGELESFIEALGDDITKKTQKNYFAFRRLRNFACVEVHPQNKNLLVYLKVDPGTVELQPGFSRDVRSIGHFGTGDLELRITDRDGLQRAVPLIQRSYEAS